MHNVQIAAVEDGFRKVDEVFIDQRFVVSYDSSGLTDEQRRIVAGMVRAGVEEGKRVRSREIKALIG